MAKTKQTLYTFMNGERVGALNQLPNGGLTFQYHDSWLNNDASRPISLSLPLREDVHQSEQVFHFFDNLLPDNRKIRERIQVRFKAPTKRCYDLLTHVGKDCVGAVQLLTTPECDKSHNITAKPIDDGAVCQLLKNYREAPLGMGDEDDFRVSIAGAQEKTALLKYKNKWHLPIGTTPTTHIIKLPIGYIEHNGMDLSGSVENEWLCLKILKAFNLPVNNAEIKKFKTQTTLAVERFDREWLDNNTKLIRLPQEDICQALGISGEYKYESEGGPGISAILNLLKASYYPKEDSYIFMKTVFLFWVLCAIDGHGKNFSIKISRGGHFRLAPIYDVISAFPLAHTKQIHWNKLKMAMSVKGKSRHYHWRHIQLRHWLSTAKMSNFPVKSMQEIIDDVFDNMLSVIDDVSATLPKNFPTEVAAGIFSGMRMMRQARTGTPH